MAAEPQFTIRVLLVEDDEADAMLLVSALKEAKVHVDLTIVTDGEQALRLLHREPPYADALAPDLVLLDLNLPRVSGHEVLKAMCADVELKLIPVIVLTTSSSPADIREAYGMQANCHLTKPVRLDAFIAMVKAMDEFWLTFVKLPTRSG